jgi:hypothetical protein
MRRILGLLVGFGDGGEGETNEEEGRGSAACFVGLVPEDMYCFSKAGRGGAIFGRIRLCVNVLYVRPVLCLSDRDVVEFVRRFPVLVIALFAWLQKASPRDKTLQDPRYRCIGRHGSFHLELWWWLIADVAGLG